MKTLMHPDYWVEIPAGEFLIGLSHKLRRDLVASIYGMMDWDDLPTIPRNGIKDFLERFSSMTAMVENETSQLSPEFTDKDLLLQTLEPFATVLDLETRLTFISLEDTVWLDRFYIARFPITEYQYLEFKDGSRNLPSPLVGDSSERRMAIVNQVRQFCQQFGIRLPSKLEWEKAARGTDGRLYPWGNNWNLQAGYFYRGQSIDSMAVDAFPQGISPYGVWAMVGDRPEFVTIPSHSITIAPSVSITTKGCHTKETSEEWAWFDHIVAHSGRGKWTGLRPVLDKWPIQQWQGVSIQEEANEATTPETNPLLNPFEWLVLKMQSATELEPVIEAIEAEQNLQAQTLLKKFLQNDPANEQAWLLMVLVSDDSTRQQDCLQQALTINPQSEIGLKLQARLADNLL